MRKPFWKAFIFLTLSAASAYVTVMLFTLGKGSVLVPDVCERFLPEAKSLLREKGLKVEESFCHSLVEEGKVVSQYPSPYTKVKKGRKVKVVVSKGPTKHRVPHLVGKRLEEAKELLEKEGFSTSFQRVSYTHWSREKETVIAQNPEAGSILPEGAVVKLLVSMGRRPLSFYMPSLCGKGMQFCKKLLSTLGTVTEIVYRSEGLARENKVLFHIPAPFTKLKEGEKVILFVSKGKRREKKNSYFLLIHKTPPGLLPKRVCVHLYKRGEVEKVYEKLLPPSTIFYLPLKKEEQMCVRIFVDGVLMRQVHI